MKTVIFLGAGASKVEGIPVQDEILKLYFQSNPHLGSLRQRSIFDIDLTLINFFKGVFNIDMTNHSINTDDIPTFEEVIGLLDLAEIRKETIRFDKVMENAENNISSELKLSGFQSAIFNNMENNLLRLYLIVLIAKVLSEKLTSTRGLYYRLVNRLNQSHSLSDIIFVTTNYDTLLDNSIIELFGENSVDYGIEFANTESPITQGDFYYSAPIKLLKLHGSLNWLYCPFCNSLRKTDIVNKRIELVTDFSKAICSTCNSIILPVIIPPTFFKDISNVFLKTVWNKTENILRDVENIIFCGYSFCDSDIHIKYLLKKAQLSSNHKIHFKVFNNYDGKTTESINEEKLRYQRFLGKTVNYTDGSFIDFAENPLKYI